MNHGCIKASFAVILFVPSLFKSYANKFLTIFKFYIFWKESTVKSGFLWIIFSAVSLLYFDIKGCFPVKHSYKITPNAQQSIVSLELSVKKNCITCIIS